MYAFSPAVRNARAQVIADALDAGSGPGEWRFYTGPQPAAGGALTTQTLLATVLLTDPCGTVTDGVLTLTSAGDVLAAATGIIAWARFTDSAGGFVLDADVGTPGSGAAVTIDNPQVYAGGTVRIVSATLTEA